MRPALQIIDLAVADENKRFSSAGSMASTMVEIPQSKGRCTPKDLFAKGFSPEAVTQHWHLAHSIASLEFKLMGHKPKTGLKSLLRRS